MGGWGGEERKGGLLTEHEGTSRVDGYVQYLDCSDDFTDVYMCQTYLFICFKSIVYYMSIIPQ